MMVQRRTLTNGDDVFEARKTEGLFNRRWDNWEIDARDGNDFVQGGNKGDIIQGGLGRDTLYGLDGDDKLYAGSSNSAYNPDNSRNFIYGGDGDDLIIGALGDDMLFGEFDDDHIDGGGGNDLVSGGSGDDLLYGGYGVDSDRLFGSAGNDKLLGGDGSDFLFGGYDDDHLIGYERNTYPRNPMQVDVLDGGPGRDIFYIGDGTTIFYEESNNSYAVIEDFSYAEFDKIAITGSISNYSVWDIGADAYIVHNSDLFNTLALVKNGAGFNLIETLDFISV